MHTDLQLVKHSSNLEKIIIRLEYFRMLEVYKRSLKLVIKYPIQNIWQASNSIFSSI